MSSSESEKSLDVLLNKVQKNQDAWDPDAVLEEALKERERLLTDHPELARLQADLDSRLENVDDFESRMKVIGRMIGNRLNRLTDECEKLEDLLDDVGIDVELPITRFKQSLRSRTFLLENDDDDN